MLGIDGTLDLRMNLIFERDCDHCGVHYRGTGKQFCSSLCRAAASRNRIHFTCKNCGAQCERPASYAKYSAAGFCSAKCKYAFAKGRSLPLSSTIRKRRNRIHFTCKHCGVKTERAASRVSEFCSRKCRFAGRGTQEFQCLNCGKPFTARVSKGRRYCSAKCAHEHRRPRRARGAKIELTCEVCGKAFRRYPSETTEGRGRFCSLACKSNTMRREQNRQKKALAQWLDTVEVAARKPVDPARLLGDADAWRIFSFSPRLALISRRPGSPTARPAE